MLKTKDDQGFLLSNVCIYVHRHVMLINSFIQLNFIPNNIMLQILVNPYTII